MRKLSRILTLIMVVFLLLGLFSLGNLFVAGGCYPRYSYKVISSIPPGIELKWECAGIYVNETYVSLVDVNDKSSFEIKGWTIALDTFDVGNLALKGTLPETTQYVDIKATFRHGVFSKIIMMFGYWWLIFFVILVLKIIIRRAGKKSGGENSLDEMLQPKE